MVILLVEDDNAVRKLMRTVLSGAGHTVLDAGTGEVAVSLVESIAEPIDLLITDVVLPHLTGWDLVQWTRSIHPQARVIYISGYLESEPPQAWRKRELGPSPLAHLGLCRESVGVTRKARF